MLRLACPQLAPSHIINLAPQHSAHVSRRSFFLHCPLILSPFSPSLSPIYPPFPSYQYPPASTTQPYNALAIIQGHVGSRVSNADEVNGGHRSAGVPVARPALLCFWLGSGMYHVELALENCVSHDTSRAIFKSTSTGNSMLNAIGRFI